MSKEAIAEAIDINAIMRSAIREAEKKANLSSVLLRRDNFAKSAVSTGSLCLDKILGGGIPGGRIIGISGPERAGKTLLATQIGANQVSEYRFLNYMDAEGSTDPIFLAARGIDFNKYRGRRNKNNDLLPKEVDYVNFYQPSTVEQIANYIHTLSAVLPENRNPDSPFCIYVLDSVVALITDEIDGDVIDANKMAMHARAYSTYLPIINSDLVKSGSTLIYTNQLRQKPMVSYGCLQGDNPISFVDGRVHYIREIVDKKIEGEVWAYDENDKQIKPAKIINWFDNGVSESSDDWIRIKTEGPGSKNGLYSITVTKNHKVLKSSGDWVESKDLKIGDELVTKCQRTIEEGSLAEKGQTFFPLSVKVIKLSEGLGHRYNRKYDLEVEGFHNYLAGHTMGGLIVHNSNMYEPAGDALKFFASARLMLSATKPKYDEKDHPFLTKEVIAGVTPKEGGVWEEPHIDNNGDVIGTDKYIYTGIKTVKNKIFTPFQKCWMRIQFEENGNTGHGLDPVFDIFTFLTEEGYIAPSQNAKGKDVKGRYDAYSDDSFDPVKELDMPGEFDYYEFKRWVTNNPGLVTKIREKLLVSGLIYSKEESIKIDENVKREAEEAEKLSEKTTLEEIVEEEDKKHRGRPKGKG